MSALVCIVCPRGCRMEVEGEGEAVKVSGNFCKKGYQFALSETTNPMRTVCTTVKTVFPEIPVLPVKTSSEVPKDKIFNIMNEISKVSVDKKLSAGDNVIENILGLGVDIVATSSVLQKL